MKLQPGISRHLDALVAFRRDLHAHPELKYEEQRTAERVAAALERLGLPVHRGLGKTGVVASLRGRGPRADDPARAIGLRADMDALPVHEGNTFAHVSTHPGRMHACGHDGHTAMLLGAATVLAENPDFDGTVHFIFQPAEEGGAGARAMMDDGLFRLFPMQAVFALHNWPALKAGEFGVRVGPIMAAACRFEIRVTGRGAHAAMPHTGVDPIPVACAIVTQLQLLVSRGSDPLDSAVLTVGQIDSGTVENIIPSLAVIKGTCRTLRNETMDMLVEGLERIAGHVAAAHHATAEVIIKPGYPCTVNHAKETRFAADVMTELVGERNVHRDILPAMTSEDFGFMLEAVPGCYGFIGNGGVAHACEGLHSPNYDFNDDILGLGSSFFARVVQRWFANDAAG
jgi:hippurate hydrolase